MKLPLPLRHVHPHLMTDPTHHPKRHPDRISRFATVHFSDTDTHTDRLTDGIGDSSIQLVLTLY